MNFRRFPLTLALTCVVASFATGNVVAFAQDEADDAVVTTAAEEKAALKEALAQPDVQEELEEPDGATFDGSDPENWKVFAIGTGTYDFNDAEERKDATAEAALEAKAAMAKFVKERLATESQLDILAERESRKSKGAGKTELAATTKRTKTTLTHIHNSAEEILSGVLTLETTATWDGDSGEVRVKIGQSQKSLDAAEKFKTRTAASVGRAESNSGSGASPGSKTRAKGPATTKRKSKTDF
jgi:hypothetical protein